MIAKRRRRPVGTRARLLGAVALLGLLVGLLVLWLGGGERTHAGEPRFFSAASFWNVPLSKDAPLDPSSRQLVARLSSLVAAEQRARSGPTINTASYSVPIYTVGPGQPTVPVTLTEHAPDAELSAAWKAVPLPADARPAGGTDAVLVVHQPSTDRMWEFWKLRKAADGWRAKWGGAMRNVSRNKGIFDTDAWPGAKTYWGTAATSLPLAGGVMTLDELKRGEINHVLALDLPEVRAGAYSWPAQRTDGQSQDPSSIPEGARLRLDPKLDLDALKLPKMTLMMARAAQRYGMVIRDFSGVVSFQAEDPTRTGTDPYYRPGGFFGGQRAPQLLSKFPWDRLKVLKLQLRR